MSGAVYAAVSDITAIGRTLSAQQEQAAGVLLAQASAALRLEAADYGVSIDRRIADPISGDDYALLVKSVVVAAVCRALDAAEQSAPISDFNTYSVTCQRSNKRCNSTGYKSTINLEINRASNTDHNRRTEIA